VHAVLAFFLKKPLKNTGKTTLWAPFKVKRVQTSNTSRFLTHFSALKSFIWIQQTDYNKISETIDDRLMGESNGEDQKTA